MKSLFQASGTDEDALRSVLEVGSAYVDEPAAKKLAR
jgi:hypothetical protein